MISICEKYAVDFHITFNPIQSKPICDNIDSSSVPPIYLNKESISIVNCNFHLGNYISSDIHDRNIINNVCHFYQRSNSIIHDFYVCDSETLDSLVCTCMDVNYGI